MPPMRRVRMLPALAGALALSGCAPPARPPETFEWAGRPVTLDPPPVGWRREGYNQGGWLGVYFVRERSVGERILVAEHHPIGARDGRAVLRELLERFDTYDERALRRALRTSHYRTDDPLSPLESEVAVRVNESLDRALMNYMHGDPEGARREIGGAVRESQQLRLTLTDVIERVEFRPERRQEPWRWDVRGRREGEVAGQPAVFVDYLYRSPERVYSCRDAYFVCDNHLFMASFHGLKHDLQIFDRVVAWIRLPDPPGPSR